MTQGRHRAVTNNNHHLDRPQQAPSSYISDVDEPSLNRLKNKNESPTSPSSPPLPNSFQTNLFNCDTDPWLHRSLARSPCSRHKQLRFHVTFSSAPARFGDKVATFQPWFTPASPAPSSACRDRWRRCLGLRWRGHTQPRKPAVEVVEAETADFRTREKPPQT